MILKKRFVTAVCAAALALALPTLAWASPSPSFDHAAGSKQGTSITINDLEGYVYDIQPTDKPSKNVPSGAEVIETFVIKGNATNLDLTFQVGKDYAGKNVIVYIEHNDGATEQQSATVESDGSFSIHVDRLSSFSIVLDDSDAGSNSAAAGTDPTAKSPDTNADLGGVAALTALMALSAVAVFAALRKMTVK